MSGRPGTTRVVVTGGGSGIGRAVALRLAREGGRVVVVGRRADRLAETASLLPERITALACDLSSEVDRADLLERCARELGGIDGLVCAAGVAKHRQPGAIDDESLCSTLEVNLVAPLRLGEQAVSVLEPGGGVVFVSSTLAIRPVRTSAVYSAAKAGMDAAMRSLALAGAPRGVRFNSVAPGLVDTDMLRGRPQAELDALEGLAPLGRFGTPDEIAEAVVHLLAAPWTTGTVHVIDGGLLLRE